MLLLAENPAKANLIYGTDPTFGANSLTIDTSSGEEWLNLPYTDGLTYQQVAADIGTGGTYSGFRFATVQDVLVLYQSAGIPGFGFYPTSSSAIASFLSQMEAYSTSYGQLELTGLVTGAPPGSGAQDAMAIYVTGIGNAGVLGK